MSGTSLKKVQATTAPEGEMGQRYLASGKSVAMRMWRREAAGEADETHTRDYETVGYVIEGRAELTIAGQTLILEPGDSWLVPAGAEHSYEITDAFTAIEATSPPAHAHGRDK
ncbi:MAG: cupin domain-containing protein [Geminicoccaceae bacterium]|nr:cupin domain-containing protein [Geminicoccaceae bacterium]